MIDGNGVSTSAIVVLISELVSLWVIWRIWKSSEPIILKVGLTIIAPIPVLGPVIALWIGNFPNPAPEVFRDKYRYSTDVFDRWRGVFEARNPVRRFHRWRDLMKQREHDV